MTAIHCEVWAGTPNAPYKQLLRREEAPTPSAAVRRLTGAADWLGDHLDGDPADPRPVPSASLRRWTKDGLGHEDLRVQLAAGKYVHEAVSVTGADGAFYTLAAMPAAGCVCLPQPFTAAVAAYTAGVPA
ncbi:hypothetical protein ABZY68_25535 [Streptomyces sp. NPDC006482]|uniref:hypothetical protein n=1 Tax=Streptomyces sp. NPDC006482 TaxID=3154306 RepID=UPI0033AAE4CE